MVTKGLPHHREVISIANRHTVGAFYHFLMDGVARLPMVEGILKQYPQAKIHIVRPIAGNEKWMGRTAGKVRVYDLEMISRLRDDLLRASDD